MEVPAYPAGSGSTALGQGFPPMSFATAASHGTHPTSASSDAPTGTKSSLRKERKAAKAHAASWLRESLIEKEGAVVPREEVFRAYLAECHARENYATNNAAFGKLFRKVFPDVGHRRLGKRGGNKMHHLNIEWRRNLQPDDITHLEAIAAERQLLRQQQEQQQQREQHQQLQRRPHPLTAKDFILIDSNTPASAAPAQETSVGMPRNSDSSPMGRSSPSSFLPLLGRGSEEEQEEVIELIRQDGNPPRSRRRVADRKLYQGLSKRRLMEYIDVESGLTLQEILQPASINNETHLGILYAVSEYRSFFRRETWGCTPLNPMCLKLSLISQVISTNEGSEEASPLALSVYCVISMSSYVLGDYNVSREYYYKARRVLGELFDQSNFDVACVLVLMSSWSRVFASDAKDAKEKEVYCLTLGATMCENLGAINTDTYINHVRLLSVHQMNNPLGQVEKARQHPKYNPSWKPAQLRRRPTSTVFLNRVGNIYGPVIKLYLRCMNSDLTSEERADIVMSLYDHLDCGMKLIQDLQSCMAAQFSYQLEVFLNFALSLCVVICTLLNSPRQRDFARSLVLQVLSRTQPQAIVLLLEMAANNFFFLNIVLGVLAKYSEFKLIQLLDHKVEAFREQHYWIKGTCERCREALLLAGWGTGNAPGRPEEEPPVATSFPPAAATPLCSSSSTATG